MVLATPADLIGSALGQSEEKTNALLDKAPGCVLNPDPKPIPKPSPHPNPNQAAGCVLVIDEAYGLDPNGAASV